MEDIYLVHSSILPDVFKKVVDTKDLIASGVAKNASEAVKMTGISRSTFYKYKDFVFKDKRNDKSKMVTLCGILDDRPGVLSSFVSELYKYGANILTVNQDVPDNGRASVTVTMGTEYISSDINKMIEYIRSIDGVQSLNQVTG